MNEREMSETVLVTGGAGDIGRAIASRLAQGGAHVAIWDLVSQVSIDQVVDTLPKNGGKSIGISCDITDVPQVQAALIQTRKILGPVTVLVNSAGLGQYACFLDVSPEQWQKIVDTNLVGPANTIRAVIPDMLHNGHGVIVNICSIWSTRAGPMRSAYIASKWGLLGLTRALSEEYRDQGIRFVAISPGPVLTNMTKSFVSDSSSSNWMRPEDVAQVVEYVVSAKGRNFVGSELEMFGWGQPAGEKHTDRSAGD